uniref:Ig-like domain-containing protein n=1 Tax=Paramormyrops kingsleyae TaxID=1676925 RepID=A0A3B3RS12_9TELE
MDRSCVPHSSGDQGSSLCPGSMCVEFSLSWVVPCLVLLVMGAGGSGAGARHRAQKGVDDPLRQFPDTIHEAAVLFTITFGKCCCVRFCTVKRCLLILAAAADFKERLKNVEAKEGESVTLRCELSKPGAPVEWRKGGVVLKSGDKFLMKQKDCSVELKISDVKPEDSGEYCCQCGDKRTTANVQVNGRMSPLCPSHYFCFSWVKNVMFFCELGRLVHVID